MDYGDYAPLGIDAISDRQKKLPKTLKRKNVALALAAAGRQRKDVKKAPQ